MRTGYCVGEEGVLGTWWCESIRLLSLLSLFFVGREFEPLARAVKDRGISIRTVSVNSI